jgi:hypothetical protein
VAQALYSPSPVQYKPQKAALYPFGPPPGVQQIIDPCQTQQQQLQRLNLELHRRSSSLGQQQLDAVADSAMGLSHRHIPVKRGRPRKTPPAEAAAAGASMSHQGAGKAWLGMQLYAALNTAPAGAAVTHVPRVLPKQV